MTVLGVILFGLVLMVWIALVVVFSAGDEMVEDVYRWIADLPRTLRIIIWIGAFPWMLALAIWRSGRGGKSIRVVSIAAIAISTLVVAGVATGA